MRPRSFRSRRAARSLLHIVPKFTPRRLGGACAWPCVRLGARGLRAWRARWGVPAARRAFESRRTVSVPPSGAIAFCRSSSSRVSRCVWFPCRECYAHARPVSMHSRRGGGRLNKLLAAFDQIHCEGFGKFSRAAFVELNVVIIGAGRRG